MSDNLRDKFDSDDEYNEFKNAFNDYKNQDSLNSVDDNLLKEVIKFQKEIYKAFVLGKKSYLAVPEELAGNKNSGMYLFYFPKIKTEKQFDETISLILN